GLVSEAPREPVLAVQKRGSVAPADMLLEEPPSRRPVMYERQRALVVDEPQPGSEEPPAEVLVLGRDQVRVEETDRVEHFSSERDVPGGRERSRPTDGRLLPAHPP